MIKLKKLLNEGEESKKFSPEVKKHFLEIVSTYNKYQEMMDRKSDIVEVAETLGGIIEAAKELAINEGDDWFDKHTVKRNMNELGKLGQQFEKVVVEAKQLDQRLGGLYEDMGHILSRYYKIGEITEDEMKSRLGMRNESKLNEVERDKLMKIGSTMIVGGNNLIKPAKMKLVSIDYLPKDKKYSYKFQGGGRTQYYTDDLLAKKLETQNESVNEGSKRFHTKDNVGTSKYTINYHDGKSKHKDGSDFYGIKTFKNKKDYETEKQNLVKQGYKETQGWTKESIKESFTPQDIAMIKKVVDKEKRLIGLSPIFKKMGWHTDFVMIDSVPPHLKLKKKKNDKATYLLVNKKYVDKPDWVSGEIAGGLDESKQSALNEQDLVHLSSIPYYVDGDRGHFISTDLSSIDGDVEFGSSEWKKISKKLSSKDKKTVKSIIDGLNESDCKTCGK